MCEFQKSKRLREKSMIQRSKSDLNISSQTPPSKKLQFFGNQIDNEASFSVSMYKFIFIYIFKQRNQEK